MKREMQPRIFANMMSWIAWAGYDPRDSHSALVVRLPPLKYEPQTEVSEAHSESEANRYMSMFLVKQAG